MTKISIEEVEAAMRNAHVETSKQSQILQHLKEVAEELKQQNSSTPKTKNEFGVILYDTNNELVGKEFTASIYSIKAGDNHSTVLSRISEATRNQNEAAKRKKNIIETIGGAFQNLKRKFIKEKNVALKTKEVVRVIISQNKLV